MRQYINSTHPQDGASAINTVGGSLAGVSNSSALLT